jgi:hypothetical protein
MHAGFWCRKLEGKKPLGKLGIVGSNISKWILKN